MLGCCFAVILLGTIGAERGAAVAARHRAETAADLAALAGAGQIGVTGAICPAADQISRANGARLTACEVQLNPDGRSGTVVVGVLTTARFAGVGLREITAHARAGRLPADATAPP